MLCQLVEFARLIRIKRQIKTYRTTGRKLRAAPRLRFKQINLLVQNAAIAAMGAGATFVAFASN